MLFRCALRYERQYDNEIRWDEYNASYTDARNFVYLWNSNTFAGAYWFIRLSGLFRILAEDVRSRSIRIRTFLQCGD
jgi:hypothetical protein